MEEDNDWREEDATGPLVPDSEEEMVPDREEVMVEEEEEEDSGRLISLEDLAATDHPCLESGQFSIFHSEEVSFVADVRDLEYDMDLDGLLIISKYVQEVFFQRIIYSYPRNYPLMQAPIHIPSWPLRRSKGVHQTEND